MRPRPRLAAALLVAAGCSATAVGTYVSPDAAHDAPTSDATDATALSDALILVDTGLPEDCATPFDDNGDGRANEGCPCAAGESRACFERPMSSLQEGCRMGTQSCGDDGLWGACMGSWLPDAQGRCLVTERFSDTTVTRTPVDVVWLVDTSGSMVAETAAVNANLNRFATSLAQSGLDYRVVMIAARGTGRLRVCVPPPLGGANCADGPRFRHVPQFIGSRNPLQILLSTYSQWRDFLRPGTHRVIVAVTDDDSNLSADAFDAMLRANAGWDEYVFNSIVGFESRADCPTLSRRGSVYLTLTERTGGQRARVCDPDWSGTFTSFAHTIASHVISWRLSHAPRLDTFEVWLTEPGAPERRLLTGWTYEPATRLLSLSPDMAPALGSWVRVVYRPAATSP